MRYAELTYARPRDPLLKRAVIRSVEELSGRRKLVGLYGRWREGGVGDGIRPFSRMLDIMQIRLVEGGALPTDVPQRLVMIANHPFGIGDGVTILSLAERLGRPFRVLIAAELMEIPEMAAYGLPVSFEETKAAIATNMETRREALRLLAEGTTIVVFPAGGVATAPRVFGLADDLPWKQFTARLVQQGQASVLPIRFWGQNGPLFHLVSKWSQTLRYGLLMGCFRRLYGRQIEFSIGKVIPFERLRAIGDRKTLTESLRQAVFELSRPQHNADVVPFRQLRMRSGYRAASS